MKNKSRLFFLFFILYSFLLHPYDRIVTLSPALGEIVFALGDSNRIVGISSYTQYPKEITKKTKVGTFYTLNYEIIMALKPDAIFTYKEDLKTEEILKNQPIKIFKFKHRTIKDILDSIKEIGDILNKKKKAKELIHSIKKELEKIKKSVKKRKKVIVIIARDRDFFKNIYILGNGDFLSELLRDAGGDNLYRGNLLYPKVSGEFFLKNNPDLIIELIPDLKQRGFTKKDVLEEWKRFLNGKFSKKVKIITEPYMVIPGPRIPLIAKKFLCLLNREK